MEQACHRCGAAVPTDAPFCSQCGAPQVRIPENLTSSLRPDSDTLAAQDALSKAASGGSVSWRHALPSASTAGLAMAIASSLPIVSAAFPLWMLAGGWLAVVLYRRRTLVPILSTAIGSKVGALAGLLGFFFFAIFTSAYLAIATVVLHQGEQIRATLRAVLEQAASSNQDPRAQAIVQWMQTPEGLALVVVFSMFLFLLAFLLFSTAGGIFAASLWRRRLRQ